MVEKNQSANFSSGCRVSKLEKNYSEGSKRVQQMQHHKKQRARAGPIFNVKMQLNLCLRVNSTTEKM
jgi:hypothetical protein